MKCSIGVYVLVGIVWMMVAGCESFESSAPQGTRNEYSKFIDAKMEQLRESHERLVVQFQQRGLESKRQTALHATLDDLTEKGEAFQARIEALKSAKGQDWLVLQFGMNETLEELAQAYERALAKYRVSLSSYVDPNTA